MYSEKEFLKPNEKYTPYCFFFLNDEFEKEHMTAMQDEMEKQGFSVGYLQDRGITKNSFLTDGFFDTVKAIAENAKLPLGLCDEIGGMYGWSAMQYADVPKSVSLCVKLEKINGGYTVPDCFFAVSFKRKDYKIDNKTLRLLKSGDIENINEEIYVFNKYHAKSRSGSDIDYLTPKTADVILSNVHEKIKKNLSKFFGNKITALFMDIEGDYGYKLCWSEELFKVYTELFGDDFYLNMPLLFERDADGKWISQRYKWFTAVTHTYSKFFGKLAKWCRENNLEFTGHTWEENLYGQVMQVGDFYEIEKNFSIIGTDSLRLECFSPRDFAEARTIAFMENKRFMCEAIGCAGNSLSALEIKRAVNHLTAWGVNHVIFHGIYTDRRTEKHGFAPDMFSENPYWDGFNKISDYIKRTSYINDETRICAHTVLYNPIDSVKSLLGDYALSDSEDFSGYIIEQRDMLKCENGLIIKEIEDSYSGLIDSLTKNHTEFLVYDTSYLLNSDFSDIKNIIIPSLFSVSKAVLKKLCELSREGKNIYFTGRTPFHSLEDGEYDSEVTALLRKIKNAKSYLDIKPDVRLLNENFRFVSAVRERKNEKYIWICSEENESRNAVFEIDGEFENIKKLNCETGAEESVYSISESGKTKLYMTLKPYEGFFVKMSKSEEIVLKNWIVSVSDKKLKVDTLSDWSEYGVQDYCGVAVYETSVSIENPKKAILELGEVYHTAKVFVNDSYVDMKLWKPYAFDITKYLKNGENKIRIECGNLLSTGLPVFEYKDRWQTGIHRTNPIDSVKSGIIGNVILKIY